MTSDSTRSGMLDDWLAVRGGLRLRGTAPLFCVLHEQPGRPIRTANIRVTLADRHAMTIGHLCRGSIIEFSDQLAAEHGVGPFDSTQTKEKIRAVFAKHEDVSRTIRRSLETLLDCWRSLIDLANRQGVHETGLCQQHEIELVTGVHVTAIEPAERRVHVDHGAGFVYDRLLIATGAEPRKLDIPGAGLEGVHYLRTLADCDATSEALLVEDSARPGRENDRRLF